jgi:mgtE-like transporter
MVTALGDMATLPTLYLATFLVHHHGPLAAFSATVCVLVAGAATIRSYSVGDPIVRRIVFEMTAVILLTPLLDIASGAVQQARLGELRAAPVLFVLIPPFVSQAGALGGIFSSRISSKLQLGVVTPRGLPEVPALVDASMVFGLGVVVFAMIGLVAVGLTTLTTAGVHDAALVVASTILAGLIAMPITIVTSYYLAIVSYRFGLDPDNQTVPIITSVMDLAGVATLLFVMSLSGVLPHG